MGLFSQIDRSTIEFGIITGERSSSIYTTTLTEDSFRSWLEVKVSASIDGFIFEIEIYGHLIGFEVLAVIEGDESIEEDFD